jgi:hypothetical protein
MAFLPFEQVYGSSVSGTYQHTPDPTAKDPESGKQQFVCASARLLVLLACPRIKLMLPAPGRSHWYSGAQDSPSALLLFRLVSPRLVLAHIFYCLRVASCDVQICAALGPR